MTRLRQLWGAAQNGQLGADTFGAAPVVDDVDEGLREGVLAPDEQAYDLGRGAIGHRCGSSPSSTANREPSRATSRA